MDSRLIIQVIINIVDNALKYTPKGSKIEIYARKENQMIAISLQIMEKELRIVQKKRFLICFILQTVKLQTAEEVLDWGCSSVSRIIQAHGGTIQVADECSTWYDFYITLQAEEVT